MSGTSKISSEQLKLECDSLNSFRHKPSTRATYHSVWRKFNEFIIKLDVIPPSWEERASLFCAYLVKIKNLQSATIKSYLSAIKAKLADDNYKWNQNLMLFSSLTNIGVENDEHKNRLPIQSGLFNMLHFELNRMLKWEKTRIFLILLYRAIFMCLYYGLMRIGEVTLGPHALKAINVHQGRNKTSILLVLYSSKTHKKSDGPEQIKIKQEPFDHPDYEPVVKINKYIEIRPPYMTENEQLCISGQYTS